MCAAYPAFLLGWLSHCQSLQSRWRTPDWSSPSLTNGGAGWRRRHTSLWCDFFFLFSPLLLDCCSPSNRTGSVRHGHHIGPSEQRRHKDDWGRYGQEKRGSINGQSIRSAHASVIFLEWFHSTFTPMTLDFYDRFLRFHVQSTRWAHTKGLHLKLSP